LDPRPPGSSSDSAACVRIVDQTGSHLYRCRSSSDVAKAFFLAAQHPLWQQPNHAGRSTFTRRRSTDRRSLARYQDYSQRKQTPQDYPCISDVLDQRIDIKQEFQNLDKIPCIRNSLLYGIGGGTGIGAIRFLGTRSEPRSMSTR